MVERTKRVKKGIESLKEEIEKHFEKLSKDLEDGNIDRGRYHAKEIDKSLINALELKIKILGANDSSAERYKERLSKLRKDFDI
jgi:hypothetical protein